jgi:NhaP-type Na+/H+ or K+/H+ antiporter
MSTNPLLTVGVLLAAGLGARAVAAVVGAPEMLLLVIVGAVLGPHAISIINVPSHSAGAKLIFTLGVSAILFYGGLNLSLRVLHRVATSLALLVVPGVVLTALVVGAIAHIAFGMDWRLSLLVGAVLSPTDPAILIPLFVGTSLRPKVMQTVIAESAFNDPTGAVLALTLAGTVLSGSSSLALPALDFIREVAESVGVGLVAGVVLSGVVSSRRFGIWRDSAAIAFLAVVTIAYVSLNNAGGSGYLGAFLAGLIVGNMELLGLSMHDRHSADLKSFAANVADVVTLLVFLVLGANLPLGELAGRVPASLLVVAALVFVARPLAVMVCTLPDRRARWTRAELAFLCWTRETGVVPAALVGVLAARGIPNHAVFASVVTIAIVGTLIAQAMPARRLAGHLGLLEKTPP